MGVPSVPPTIKDTPFVIEKDGDTVSIDRRPAFSNVTSLFKNRVFNDTNDLVISFRDATWPKYDVLDFDIFPITKQEADDLEDFFVEHVGEIVSITINNVVYEGIFQNPQIELIDEKDNDCNYKVTFTFETQVCI